MSFFDRSILAFSLGIVTLAVACGGATQEPSSNEGSQGSEVAEEAGDSAIIAASQQCNANPPPNARCAAACPYGYKGPAGTYTCQCCTAPAPEVCGGPPPNARCKACPGGGNSYKQINGKPSCECCAVPDAGADAGEICGGPPPNARCMACPSGYKQIDGQPSCQCCGS